MSRTKVVVPIALLLGLGAIATLIILERRAERSQAAQVSLANVSAQVTQLQLIPLAAPVVPGTDAQKLAALRGLLNARKQEIFRRLDDLSRESPPPAFRDVQKRVRAALRAAAEALPVWLKATGFTPKTTALLAKQGTSLVAALGALDKANGAYRQRASTLQTELLSGSVGVVAILLGAFGFLFRKSETARRELVAQRATLRSALAQLETAQVDRARLLDRTVEVAEHERIRVAADLHDGPIQRLSAVTLGFDLLANQIERGEIDRAAQLVGQIRDTLAAETVSLRRLMTELRPPILDERDLGAALRDCAEQVFEGSSVNWEVGTPRVEIRLAPEVEAVAYRVVREALVNVRKHAPDANVIVMLDPTPEVLGIVIADNGPGFDENAPVALASGARYGLIGMQERVESVGGTWHLDTATEGGTKIEVSLPWKPRRPLTPSEEPPRLAA